MAIQVAVLNVVMLVLVAALPRRRGARPELGRRAARALLRFTGAERPTLARAVGGRIRRARARVGRRLHPRTVADLRAVAFSVALVAPVLAMATYAVSGDWSMPDSPEASGAAPACAEIARPGGEEPVPASAAMEVEGDPVAAASAGAARPRS